MPCLLLLLLSMGVVVLSEAQWGTFQNDQLLFNTYAQFESLGAQIHRKKNPLR